MNRLGCFVLFLLPALAGCGALEDATGSNKSGSAGTSAGGAGGRGGGGTAGSGGAAGGGAGAAGGSAGVDLTAVENELLANINAERAAAGLPELVRDPGHDTIMAWWVAQLEATHQLGHVDQNGRDSEGRARYYGGDDTLRCSEIVQWWGGTPDGKVHYDGYFNSPPHHMAYMEEGAFNLGPTTHTGVAVVEGTGPAGSQFEGRDGSYSGLMFCDRAVTITIDPFSE